MNVKKIIILVLALCAVLSTVAADKGSHNTPYKIHRGVIEFAEPAPVAGQSSMLAFAAAPIDTVRVGFIGLGMRGPGAVNRFTYLDGVRVVALCDLYPERVASAQNILTSRGLPKAAEYSGDEGWKQLCERDDIDLVYIATPWLHHVPMAVYAMQHGKHVAVEVPAAQSVADCWLLVDTSERTRRHCMMLENCVYDFFEITTLNMAQHGLFGEVLHGEGAYIHNLDPYWDAYQGNWRLDFNSKNRGDVYPTHGLGPVCQVMNIHRGDKMNYLVSVDTKSVNGLKRASKKMGVTEFANGDHIVTLVRTEQGKSIEIQHNVYTPRPYSRMYQITGTDGFANKYPIEGYALKSANIGGGDSIPDYQNLDGESFMSDAARAKLMEQYKHPIVRDIEEKARKVGGHGGMDFIMDYRLVYCLRKGLPLDQDVYDAAEWCCISELSDVSASNVSMPAKVPDFTRGRWKQLSTVTFAQ